MAKVATAPEMKLPPEKLKDKPKRRPITLHVPCINIEFLPPKGQFFYGGALRQIGEDVTEALEYVPGRIFVNKITCPRFACKRCNQFTKAVFSSR